MPRRLFLALACTVVHVFAEAPDPRFRAITIDDRIQIGYGLAIADVDGDGRPDVLLADKKQFVWYRNPGPEKAREPAAWSKFLLAENLTEKDNVCIAAQDLDGDGKCEIAVGAEWNPGDTENSGAVFYLIAPPDRTKPWANVKFPSVEPTTHRMKWIKLGDGKWGLVVVPLHGRGNKNGEGAPVKVLLYRPPADLHGEWKSEVIDESMHMTHNFELVAHEKGNAEGVVLAGKEGISYLAPPSWERGGIMGALNGLGEVRRGRLTPDDEFLVAVEPMHGDSLFVLFGSKKDSSHERRFLTDKLIEAHALACGDVLGAGHDQIVVGWRGNPSRPDNNFGIHLWTPLDAAGEKWRESAVDDGGMACEDLQLADLDGDGKLDIIASGRATKNVKLYFNETPPPAR